MKNYVFQNIMHSSGSEQLVDIVGFGSRVIVNKLYTVFDRCAGKLWKIE